MPIVAWGLFYCNIITRNYFLQRSSLFTNYGSFFIKGISKNRSIFAADKGKKFLSIHRVYNIKV